MRWNGELFGIGAERQKPVVVIGPDEVVLLSTIKRWDDDRCMIGCISSNGHGSM